MLVEFENLKTFKFLCLKYSFVVDFVLHNKPTLQVTMAFSWI